MSKEKKTNVVVDEEIREKLNETIEEIVGQDNMEPEPDQEPDQEPEPEPDQEPEPVVGFVVDCLSLNVRSEASLTGSPIVTIIKGTKVEIDESESTDEFYKVTVGSEIVGYCKKEYIKIK